MTSSCTERQKYRDHRKSEEVKKCDRISGSKEEGKLSVSIELNIIKILI